MPSTSRKPVKDIGRSSLIEGAIVGRSCDIRDHVRIHEGAAIGDEVTIGSESSIMPHVRIYPYKEVETGSQLYENLIWETRASSRLFGKDGVTGLVNVDLTPETAARLFAANGFHATSMADIIGECGLSAGA